MENTLQTDNVTPINDDLSFEARKLLIDCALLPVWVQLLGRFILIPFFLLGGWFAVSVVDGMIQGCKTVCRELSYNIKFSFRRGVFPTFQFHFLYLTRGFEYAIRRMDAKGFFADDLD